MKGALYTYVRPEKVEEPELLGVSPVALRDLDISAEEAKSPEFLNALSGNEIVSWDEKSPESGVYPWAQCYGGYQFGQWAGQLGDGRAISLFETTNEKTGKRYELQLKGAGKTPYSRFADGKAVLRSSIREFVVSESLNALGIKSTRALSLVLTPKAEIAREKLEPGAIVCRFAESWLRIGTFDLLRARNDRKLLRKLADYVAEDVFGGWDKLPGTVSDASKAESQPPSNNNEPVNGEGAEKEKPIKPLPVDQSRLHNPSTSIARDTIEDSNQHAQNRYTRLYRHIVRANARTVAQWQTYAFTNGVLNTDNTSIMGLSMDFGPFAFLDTFDPSYTPNHDDHMLRYSYRNQPTIIWWNLVRLGEALGELMGAGSWVDDPEFVDGGVREARASELVERAETLITATGDEYKAIFMAEYRKGMTARLGLKNQKEEDFEVLFSELLDTMEALQLDFNQTFRRLSHLNMEDLATEEQRTEKASIFFRKADGDRSDADKIRIGKWLEQWQKRVLEDWGEGKDEERKAAMLKVNPKVSFRVTQDELLDSSGSAANIIVLQFIPKSWILDELIQRVEKKGERDILNNVMTMALNPFQEEWGWNREEEERFCGDVPKFKEDMQCSCSS